MRLRPLQDHAVTRRVEPAAKPPASPKTVTVAKEIELSERFEKEVASETSDRAEDGTGAA